MSSTTDDSSSSSTPPSSPGDTGKTMDTPEVVTDRIPENPFDNESSRILFDAVDQLQHCGASRHVAIPQLVIVGGQSTGKSSLLQSLTDIPFPVGTGCCTRFATRIVSKRTAPGTPNRFKITIVEPEVKVKDFVYPINEDYKEYVHMGETLTADEFESVMNKVSSDYMGIRSGKGPDKKNFATQVLRVELSGPGRSYFSIVDIPGLFVNPDTVNEGEMHGIKSMIVKYMKKPENFVICVADAVTDLANQGIVHLASLNVPKERCVGVLTKCDMLRDDVETSRKVVGIATGLQEHTTKPICDTWFVVRNRSSREDRSFDLAQAEAQLFEKAPWDEIDINRRGTSMLRRHLSSLLAQKIRGSFPEIRTRIQQLLTDAKASRAALGDPRPTHAKRLQYLRNIVEKYEIQAMNALEKPGLLDEGLRARNKVKLANDEFAKLMQDKGHTFQFEDPDIDPLEEVVRMKNEFTAGHKPRSLVPETTTQSIFSETTTQSIFAQTAPRGGLFAGTTPFSFGSPNSSSSSSTQKPRSTPSRQNAANIDNGKLLRDEIRKELRSFEGTQLLGLINPEVIPALYRKQTENWHKYATEHIDKVANHVALAAAGILGQVCPDDPVAGNPQLHDGLFEVLRGFWRKSADIALAELNTYSLRERSHPPQTEDPRYYQRLKAWQTIRLLRSLASVPPDSDATAIYDRLHFTIEDNMIDAVHDILKVYYQISIESFIRHINHKIIETFVSGSGEVRGPLKGLSRDWVYSLGEDEVERLAREDDIVTAKRAELDQLVSELRNADAIAQRATEATSNLNQI
ncbi:vacuolar sorting protein VPS1 [Xylaria sp. FL0933]|nr:vacuolar sorting protein VPS1 [Xylaria sp. FL0933]